MARKLKNINGPWLAGIDLDGTSVGFVATDECGEVLYHKGQPVMGARCFKEALHASEARMPRTARRRLQRARGREREMERVFAPAIAPADPDFFVRRRMSYKLMRDDIAADPAAAAWQGLLDGYPTLAHLDVDLMESDGPRDPRLVFWAIANHVVRRGHFLMEGNDVTSANSDPSAQVEALARELDALGEACGEAIEFDGGALDGMGGSWTARELQRAVSGAVSVTGDDIDAKIARAQARRWATSLPATRRTWTPSHSRASRSARYPYSTPMRSMSSSPTAPTDSPRPSRPRGASTPRGAYRAFSRLHPERPSRTTRWPSTRCTGASCAP